VLLEGLPRGMELTDVTQAMRGLEGVVDVHDLHIWSLGSSAHALSCHVLIEDMPPSKATPFCAASTTCFADSIFNTPPYSSSTPSAPFPMRPVRFYRLRIPTSIPVRSASSGRGTFPQNTKTRF